MELNTANTMDTLVEELRADLESSNEETVSAETLAEWIKEARANDGWIKSRDLYEGDLLRRLCAMAGMSGEYADAKNGDEQVVVAQAAADKLGVEIAE